jgi:hypothetical protein
VTLFRLRERLHQADRHLKFWWAGARGVSSRVRKVIQDPTRRDLL